MRLPVWLAIVGALAVTATAHARAFRQTFGATVPVEGGGCVWNLNQDYFVPRQCDSCRYGLFSACKQGHTTSPACRNVHPVYGCYCTPFGECRYKWRDHVYKTYCCCTPQSCYHGPWKLQKCPKHCFALRHKHKCGGGCSGCPDCVDGQCLAGSCSDSSCLDSSYGGCAGGEAFADPMLLPNVEPLEGESLGYIPALPRTAMGARAGGAMSGVMPGGMPSLPTLPSLPNSGATSTFPANGAMSLPPDSTY